uniref:Truncated flavin-dependent oxidoreductase n=1 Tax=Streptomyces caniferus TaxID=285557 RepID=A0A493R197_9ACTN|nr:truncated flavin-dependent oxidoreductase [Streptomyces caniferus]
MIEVPLSALEVAMVQTGTRAVETLRDTTPFAQGMESLGYHRIWTTHPPSAPSHRSY